MPNAGRAGPTWHRTPLRQHGPPRCPAPACRNVCRGMEAGTLPQPPAPAKGMSPAQAADALALGASHPTWMVQVRRRCRCAAFFLTFSSVISPLLAMPFTGAWRGRLVCSSLCLLDCRATIAPHPPPPTPTPHPIR